MELVLALLNRNFSLGQSRGIHQVIRCVALGKHSLALILGVQVPLRLILRCKHHLGRVVEAWLGGGGLVFDATRAYCNDLFFVFTDV